MGAVAPSNQNSSGSFTNLNQYTEANKDQGAGLGGKITQNVQNAANTGLNQLGQSQKEFNTAQEAAGVNAKDYDVNKLTDVAKSVYENPNTLKQSDVDAANAARTKAAAFTAGTDTGPKSLSDLNSYQTAAGSIQNAKQKADLTGTESGRETLLRDTFKRPDYSKGQSGLDQLLTQNVPENRQKFENLRSNLLGQYGLSNQQNQAIQAAADKRNQVAEGTQQAAKNVNQALWGTEDQNQKGGVLGTYQNDILRRASALNAAQGENITNAKQAIKDYLINNNVNTLGLPVDQLVNQIVQGQSAPGTATLANTVTQQDLARMNALNKLAGRDPNLIGDTALTSVDANTFNPNVNPNYSSAQQQINERVNALSHDVKTAATQAAQGSLGQAYGRDITGQEGVNYALGTTNVNMTNPAYNAQENQKIVNSLQSKLDQINQTRGKYGLPDIHLSNDEIKPESDAIWDKIKNQIKTNTKWTVDPNQWLNDHQNLTQFRDYQMAVQNAAKVSALYKKLQSLQNNPMQNVGQTTLNAAPTFNQTDYYAPTGVDNSGWPMGPNGKPINPANIITYGNQQTPSGRMIT